MRARRWGVGVVATSLATVIAGCSGDGGDRLGEASDSIALGPGGRVDVGVGVNRDTTSPIPNSLAAGPGGFIFVHSYVNWDSGPHAMAVRLDPSGALIDQPSFVLNATNAEQSTAGAAAPLGDRWFAVYGTSTSTSTVGASASVPTAGPPRVVDRRSTPLGLSSGVNVQLSCVTGGCLAVTPGRALRFDAVGSPVGAPFALGTLSATPPGLAASSTQWLSVFEAPHPVTGVLDLRANRVRFDGTVLDGDGVAFTTIGAARRQPAVASDGTSFLVAFVATEGAGSRVPGLYVQVVDASAGVSAGPPTLVAGAGASAPSVAWDGTRYWVAWQTSTTVMYARVSREGALLDAAPRAAAAYSGTQGQGPKIAAYQGRVGLLWLEVPPSGLFFMTLRADGTAEGAPRFVSYRAEAWSIPAIATDGTRFGMTCQTLAAPSGNPAPFSRGYVFDASGVVVTPAGGLARSPGPSMLFWDGARYVGFGTSSFMGPLVHHLSADGSSLSSAAPVGTIGTGAMTQVGAVFIGDVTGATEPAVRRFDTDGRSLDPFPIPFGGSGTRVLGSDGSVALGVWANDGANVYAARLSRDGDVLDALPWNLSVAGDPLVPSAVAYGGGVWTVVGSSQVGSVRRIEARQVDTTGHVLRTVVVEPNAPTSERPRVVWNGTEFVVAGTHADPSPACNLSLRVWGVSPSGAVSPPGGVLIADRPCNNYGHQYALAARADGTTAIAWRADDATYATQRCAARLLAPGMGVDAGTAVDAGADAMVDRPDVGTDTGAINDTGPADVGVTDSGPRDSGVTDSGIDVPVVMPDVPVVTDVGVTDVPAVTDAGVTDVPAVTDAGVTDVPPAEDAPLVDVAPAEDVPATDVATTDVPVTVDAGSTDVPSVSDVGTRDVGVATDASPITDAGGSADASPVTDAGASTDTGSAPPPEEEGGCDVGGRAGGRSRSPLAASLSLLALALASRRRSR